MSLQGDIVGDIKIIRLSLKTLQKVVSIETGISTAEGKVSFSLFVFYILKCNHTNVLGSAMPFLF